MVLAVRKSWQGQPSLASTLGGQQRMNVFVTDHPLTSEPYRFGWRGLRRLLFAALVWPAYLLLLGPFYALDGRGYFDFLPDGVRTVFYVPAIPFYEVFGPNNPYDDYLTFWYDDPNAAETTW